MPTDYKGWPAKVCNLITNRISDANEANIVNKNSPMPHDSTVNKFLNGVEEPKQNDVFIYLFQSIRGERNKE